MTVRRSIRFVTLTRRLEGGDHTLWAERKRLVVHYLTEHATVTPPEVAAMFGWVSPSSDSGRLLCEMFEEGLVTRVALALKPGTNAPPTYHYSLTTTEET